MQRPVLVPGTWCSRAGQVNTQGQRGFKWLQECPKSPGGRVAIEKTLSYHAKIITLYRTITILLAQMVRLAENLTISMEKIDECDEDACLIA